MWAFAYLCLFVFLQVRTQTPRKNGRDEWEPAAIAHSTPASEVKQETLVPNVSGLASEISWDIVLEPAIRICARTQAKLKVLELRFWLEMIVSVDNT